MHTLSCTTLVAEEQFTEQALIAHLRQTVTPPDPEAARYYAECLNCLVRQVDQTLLAREDLAALIGLGSDRAALMTTNHRNHALFMADWLRNYDPALLVATVRWAIAAYRARGFARAYWDVQFDAWDLALRVCLEPSARTQIAPLYTWLGSHLDTLASLGWDFRYEVAGF